MNEHLSQIILAARDRDTEGWMNILVVVAIAIVYGLSAIVKAKGTKLQGKDKGELARRPPEGKRGPQRQPPRQVRRPVGPAAPAPREYRPAVQQPRPGVARARRAVEKLAAQAQQPTRFATIKPLAKPKLGMPTPRLKPELQELPALETRIEELPEFTSKAVEELGGKRVDIAAEMPEAIHLSEILSDYADPDELRRAILHYEILGRPLSLRDPSGQIIGL